MNRLEREIEHIRRQWLEAQTAMCEHESNLTRLLEQFPFLVGVNGPVTEKLLERGVTGAEEAPSRENKVKLSMLR